MYYTHSDCNSNDVKRWKVGKEAESKDAETLKGKYPFMDDEVFIYAEHDDIWCILTDEKVVDLKIG